MKKLILGCAAAGLLVSPAAQAQDAATFKPNSAWAADYGDEFCRLVRSFSDGKDEVNLIIQRVQPGADMQLMVIGNAIKVFRGADTIGWHFLPNDAERKSMFTRSDTGDGQQYFRIEGVTLTPFTPPAPGAAFTPPPPYDRAAEQARGKNLEGLVFTTGLTKPVRIETGNLGAPIAALQACTDDLIQTWGLDAEKHKTLSVPAIPQLSPDGWLPTGTIPFSEFGKFAASGNQVRLMIDANGKPAACHIHSPTLSQSLNDKICSLLMEKASFIPAKDAGGQPVASYWLGSPLFLGPPMPMRR